MFKIGDKIKVIADYEELKEGETGIVINNRYKDNSFVLLIHFDRGFDLHVNSMLVKLYEKTNNNINDTIKQFIQNSIEEAVGKKGLQFGTYVNELCLAKDEAIQLCTMFDFVTNHMFNQGLKTGYEVRKIQDTEYVKEITDATFKAIESIRELKV
jgi:hypothetical protein